MDCLLIALQSNQRRNKPRCSSRQRYAPRMHCVVISSDADCCRSIGNQQPSIRGRTHRSGLYAPWQCDALRQVSRYNSFATLTSLVSVVRQIPMGLLYCRGRSRSYLGRTIDLKLELFETLRLLCGSLLYILVTCRRKVARPLCH